MRKWFSARSLECCGPALGLLTLVVSPALTLADGCFVAPPFVWDKHKDINEPSQKAILVYSGGQEDLILQVKYTGPVDQFGWLIPVPGLPLVQKGSMDCFYELSRYTQELWDARASSMTTLSARGTSWTPPEPVKVIEIKTVGAYEVAVLSAKDAGSLERWLAANEFSYPKDKEDVIDSYIRRQWYFVAAKIDLNKAAGFRLASVVAGGAAIARSRVAEKLSSGELHPLQIRFPTDHCVFPLKISSLNGTPSEVQLYVLSPEPLAERWMFEKQLPEIRRLSEERYQKQVEVREQIWNAARQSAPPSGEPIRAPRPHISTNMMLRMSVPFEAILHFVPVTATALPRCAREIPQLAQGTWWLTKQTWTLKPEEMEDLVFEPAAGVFASSLGGDEGYFAAANLARLGSNAVPAMVSALESTNSRVRTQAASVVEQFHDERMIDCLPALLNDPEPEVRMGAAQAARNNPSPKLADPLLALLRDQDEGVRREAMLALRRYYYGRSDLAPVLQGLMKDDNLDVRACVIDLLRISGANVAIAREQVLPMLSSTNLATVSLALSWLEHTGLGCEDLVAVLQNPQVLARLAGLTLLERMNRFQCVDLVVPLLSDPDRRVRARAATVMRQWTDQPYGGEEAAAWASWWATNKTTYLLDRYSGRVADRHISGDANHDRGCYYYDRQQFPEALKDFQKAAQMGSPSLDYSWFRIWLVQARLGQAEEATRGLANYLAHRKAAHPDDWPSKVGCFLTGKLSEADLLAAADDPNLKVDREQHCEAWFYAGTKHLIDGDKATAADYLRRCVATGIVYFEEYESAQAELKAMGQAAR